MADETEGQQQAQSGGFAEAVPQLEELIASTAGSPQEEGYELVSTGIREFVRRLNREVFPDSVFLISKAKSGTAQKTREWLAHRDFHGVTNVPLERVYFCERREDKAPIARRLRLSAFVDDRLDVLEHLQGVALRILFAAGLEWVSQARVPEGVRSAVGWAETLTILEETRRRL